MDNFEEAQSSIISIKKKDETFDVYITSVKNKDVIVGDIEEQRATSVSNRPNEINLLEK